jgi:hypothetical protein
VQFQGACVAEGCTMLVTEFMEVRSLQKLLAARSDCQNAVKHIISCLFMWRAHICDGGL